MSLAWRWQEDFAAGILRSAARDQEIGVGVSNAVNGLFDDDGDCYLRGKTVRHSKSKLRLPIRFLWTGYLTDGPIGLVSTSDSMYRLRPDGTLENFLFTPSVVLNHPVRPAVIKDTLYLPTGDMWGGTTFPPLSGMLPPLNGTAPPVAGMEGTVHLAAVGARLVIGQGRFVRFSSLPDGVHSGSLTDAANWAADDYHELPEGTVIRGLATIKDTLLVFTGYGVWSIENMALDLTDDAGNPQQVVQKLLPELGLLHEAGISEWGGHIIAPFGDRVMLLDTISAPTSVSDSIAPLYLEQVRAGRSPGGAKVFNNHYFLPWLNRDNTVAMVMVCRLNRPVRGRQTYFPWSILTGHAAGITMADISAVTARPTMLAAHMDGTVIDMGGLFNPGRGADADGTIPEFDLETRLFPTGNGQPNHVRALRLEYTLDTDHGGAEIDAAVVADPSKRQTYAAVLSDGGPPRFYSDIFATYMNYGALLLDERSHPIWGPGDFAEDGSQYWAPLDHGPLPMPGTDPAQWIFPFPIRVRYVRARFRCVDDVNKLTVHRIGFGVRPATHER